MLFLGELGDTHNFAFPTLGISVTLEVGDMILFDPYIFHGCESMEGIKQVSPSGGVLISVYTNRLTLAHLTTNGYAA